MAKKKNCKQARGWLWFWIFILVYIGAAVCLCILGMEQFTHYIAAYEVSRPQKPIESYMQQLTPEHIVDMSGDVIGQIDHKIQSEDQCRQILLDAVSGKISYAKKLNESTEDKTVYMLLCGGKTIGKVTTSAQAPDQYGFRIWQVSEESFDLSYLIGQPITVTVPEQCSVIVNGQVLDTGYCVGEPQQYALLKDLYKDYPFLPMMLTYQAGPFLGQPEAQITDPAGQPMVIDESTDFRPFIENCSADKIQALDAFLTDFIGSYVRFTASKNDRYDRYHEVVAYMQPNSELRSRMLQALDGLSYNRIKRTKILSIDFLYHIEVSSGEYLCDLVYKVDVDKGNGYATETMPMRFWVVDTADGLRLKEMTGY